MSQVSKLNSVGAMLVATFVQLVLQFASGTWGAAVGGMVIGALFRKKKPFTIGFTAGLIAAAVLLVVTAFRGAALGNWANTIGANFGLPGWALMVVASVLPALQSGGIAGAFALFNRSPAASVSQEPVGTP